MSALQSIGTNLRNREFVLDSLRAMGYTPECAAEGGELLTAVGWRNHSTSKVEIRIPKEQIRGQSYESDFGLVRNKDGVYEAVYDHINQSDKELVADLKFQVTSREAIYTARRNGLTATLMHTSGHRLPNGSRARLVIETGD